MANTKDTLGSQGAVDALVEDTLTSLVDSDITGVGAYCLSNKTALTYVDILGGGTIAANAFENSSALTSLVMRSNTMTTLADLNAFMGVPIMRGEGAVYVPSSMVSTYKADDKWDVFFIADVADYPLSSYETISDSWSDIITACGNGTYATKYSVGDTKAIEIGGSTYYMQLVAMDADVLDSDGTTTVPTTWLMWKKYYTTHTMNSTATTSGGWEASGMRSWLSGTVFPLLPSEVQAGIKEVRKYSDTYESAIVHDQQTADKLWIPSAREVFGGSSYEQTGPLYTEVYANNTRRIKYDSSGSANIWWLRSATSATAFRSVYSGGNAGSSSAGNTSGVVLGFSI